MEFSIDNLYDMLYVDVRTLRAKNRCMNTYWPGSKPIALCKQCTAVFSNKYILNTHMAFPPAEYQPLIKSLRSRRLPKAIWSFLTAKDENIAKLKLDLHCIELTPLEAAYILVFLSSFDSISFISNKFTGLTRLFAGGLKNLSHMICETTYLDYCLDDPVFMRVLAQMRTWSNFCKEATGTTSAALQSGSAGFCKQFISSFEKRKKAIPSDIKVYSQLYYSR